MNRHGQEVVEKFDTTGNHPFAKLWLMRCSHCRHDYGANSCDAHERRCPKCQSGRSGLALPVAVAAPAEPRIPTEAEKIEALKLAYQLNGNSMVGSKMIDLSAEFAKPGPNTTIVPKKKEK